MEYKIVAGSLGDNTDTIAQLGVEGWTVLAMTSNQRFDFIILAGRKRGQINQINQSNQANEKGI